MSVNFVSFISWSLGTGLSSFSLVRITVVFMHQLQFFLVILVVFDGFTKI